MDKQIKILITGDFYGGNRIDKMLKTGNYRELYNNFLTYSAHSDLAITNLESALTKSKTAISKTGPSIKSDPKTAVALKYAGINLVTLANNHIMDYGKEGLEDTIKTLTDNKINYVGAGRSLEDAQNPYYYTKSNINIAILNFAENEWSTTNDNKSGANPINPVKNFMAIKEAKENAEKAIVITHSGHELYRLPSPRMKELFRFYIEVGADVVVNHHPHCTSGYEIYKGKPIFYSIGNFIFDNPRVKNNIWNKGMAVNLKINKNLSEFEIIHFDQNAEKTGINVCSDEEQGKREHNLKEINKIISDDFQLNKSFEELVNKRSKLYRAYIEPHKNKYIQVLQNKNIIPSLWTSKKKKYLLNLIQCESHRDILVKVLKYDNSNSS